MALIEEKTVQYGKWRQLIATIAINISTVAFGMALGWASPVMIDLQNGKTPVTAQPMTDKEISWLNGIICIAAAAVLPFCSKLTEYFGLKVTGYLMIIPFIVDWILTAFATNYTCLFVARLLVGVGGSVCLFLVPLYVSEISTDSIRGQLGSFLIFSFNIGLLIGFILGAFLSYRAFALISLTVPIIYLVAFFFIPESPVYLLRKGRIIEATRSLMWLRDNSTEAVNHELEYLQSQLLDNSNVKAVGLKDLFRDRATLRGFIIALALLGSESTSGLFVMLAYASSIFQLAGSSLSPNASAVIIGIIQVLGSCLSTMAMERAGRRRLILISSIGMILSHLALGLFFLLKNSNYSVSSVNWIPIVALSLFVFINCLGLGPAPYIVASEIFSSDISGFANSISLTVMWSISFPIMQYFPLVADALGIHTCFFIFTIFCTLTCLFTYYYVPETKGKSIETILNELSGRYWKVGEEKSTEI